MSIASVIKYEGNNKTFIWKHHKEDFNTGSQLIVHESQEAVFFMNGEALDSFGPGRHTLETQNMPFVGSFFKRATFGKTPFHCELYFVNKTDQMAIKWGTDSQVQYKEPTYDFPLQIGASGEMVISVDNARKLLIKVVGTEKEFNHATLTQRFRAFLMSNIKPYLAQTMQKNDYGIFEIDSHMGELSKDLHELLSPDFKEYGLGLMRFFVTNIAKPDGDPAYEKFKELHVRQYADVAEAALRQQVSVIEEETAKKRRIIEAEGIAKKRELEGYTFQQENSFDVAKKVAGNEGAGNFSSAGIGLGVMGGIAGTMGGAMAGMANDALNPAGPGNMAAFKQKLEKLMMMKEMNLLTEDEFAAEKKNLLGSL